MTPPFHSSQHALPRQVYILDATPAIEMIGRLIDDMPHTQQFAEWCDTTVIDWRLLSNYCICRAIEDTWDIETVIWAVDDEEQPYDLLGGYEKVYQCLLTAEWRLDRLFVGLRPEPAILEMFAGPLGFPTGKRRTSKEVVWFVRYDASIYLISSVPPNPPQKWNARTGLLTQDDLHDQVVGS